MSTVWESRLSILRRDTESKLLAPLQTHGWTAMVRYRPSVWRRLQEGAHDHLRVLVDAYLAVVERVPPEQFLKRITAHRVFAQQPGALG